MWIWIGRIALTLLVLAGVGVTGVYAASEIMIRRQEKAALQPIRMSIDPAAVARGAYQARILGCDGCHERNLQGQVFMDDTLQGRLWAPNLTRVGAGNSDAELARAIRHGVRADGQALWIMPSEAWTSLSDRDTADIIAWMRAQEPAGPQTPTRRFGPLGRLAIVLGRLRPAPALAEEARATPAFDAGPAFARGRALAVTACGECHSPSLGGRSDFMTTPDLSMAATYDRAQFGRFLKTGLAPDGKPRGYMSEIGPEHFGEMTEADVDALHAYLVARAEQMPMR